MNYLLTTHGTLLETRRDRAGAPASDGSHLSHADIRAIADVATLAGFEAPIECLRQDHVGFVEGRGVEPFTVADGPFAGCRFHVDATRNLVSIEAEGRHLSAGPTGGAADWVDHVPDGWERFLPISAGELGQLVRLLSCDWIRRSDRTILRGVQMAFAPGPTLLAGPLRIPLAQNLPFEDRFDPFRVQLLLDGWRLEELRLYKPLIYYAAYRSPAVHAQLFHSISSLFEFGRYDGHVHVLTDLDHEALCRNAPGLLRERSSVQRILPEDFAGYVASKYAILEHEPAWQYQPICYLDPDIVINAAIRPMLIEMATNDRITAPLERVGPMRSWPSVGASLIKRDGYEPRFADGFNAGTLGIPNLPGHAGALRAIRRIIQNLLRADGRDHLEWVDQEVANYYSFRAGHFDTSVLNPFVRYGNIADSEVVGPLTGLVHFWATAKHDRHERMRHYIEVLRAHDRTANRFG